jgi:hypothetical protein
MPDPIAAGVLTPSAPRAVRLRTIIMTSFSASSPCAGAEMRSTLGHSVLDRVPGDRLDVEFPQLSKYAGISPVILFGQTQMSVRIDSAVGRRPTLMGFTRLPLRSSPDPAKQGAGMHNRDKSHGPVRRP